MQDIQKPVFENIVQVGIVVKNIKETAQRFADRFGIGPWYIKKYDSGDVYDMKLYSRRQDYSMILGFCFIGNIQIELIEPIDESIYLEFYKEHGEGLHHLKMKVESYEEQLKSLQEKDIKVVQSGGAHQGRRRYAYLDTKDDLGFITEIAEGSPDFERPEPDYWWPNLCNSS